jgi:hypothetical protein
VAMVRRRRCRGGWFGPVRGGAWGDEQWTGWWGEDPPYHYPVFILTHYPRDPVEMEGGTTFHFVLLGDGARLFDNLGDAEVRLEQVRAVEAPGVTHLKYRVVT